MKKRARRTECLLAAPCPDDILCASQARDVRTNEVVAIKKMSYNGKQSNEVRWERPDWLFSRSETLSRLWITQVFDMIPNSVWICVYSWLHIDDVFNQSEHSWCHPALIWYHRAEGLYISVTTRPTSVSARSLRCAHFHCCRRIRLTPLMISD